MKLCDIEGVEFSADLFSSPMYPNPPYASQGIAEAVTIGRDIGKLEPKTPNPKRNPTGLVRSPKEPEKLWSKPLAD